MKPSFGKTYEPQPAVPIAVPDLQHAATNVHPMRFRKLRITFSAICGVFCLLLLVLWVRSYNHNDVLRHTGSRRHLIQSWQGRLAYWDRVGAPNREITSANLAESLDEIIRDHIDGKTHFGRISWSRGTVLFVPHWFPILACSLIAALPWLPWQRPAPELKFRKLRFALSATSIGLCLLLIAFWVSSYNHMALLRQDTSSKAYFLNSWKGRLIYFTRSPLPNPRMSPANFAEDVDDIIQGSNTSMGFSHFFGFGHVDTFSSTISFASYWFPVAFMAMFATIPWLPWRCRFSIRTMLIAITLASMILALIIYVISSAKS